MIKKFIKWYEDNFKKNPIVLLIVSIGIIIAGIGSVSSGLKEIYNFSCIMYDKLFVDKYDKQYELIEGISTGVSSNYLFEQLGAPLFEKKLFQDQEGSQYYEMAYSDKCYFLHFILDEDRIVLAYTVIAKADDFHPNIPIPNKDEYKLGIARLADMSDRPESISINFSSKFWCYTETNYYGNPGFYRYYLFGSTPLGINYVENEASEFPYFPSEEEVELGLKNSVKINDERKKYIPNSFCITSESLSSDVLDYIQNGYLGFDYFYARTLD